MKIIIKLIKKYVEISARVWTPVKENNTCKSDVTFILIVASFLSFRNVYTYSKNGDPVKSEKTDLLKKIIELGTKTNENIPLDGKIKIDENSSIFWQLQSEFAWFDYNFYCNARSFVI